MRKMISWLVLVGSILAFGNVCSAQEETPVPQWDESTRLALGQCYVAEAGWRNRTEHAAMGYVLIRRWQRYLDAHPGSSYTFEQMIRQYCAVHRTSSPSPHQRWVRNLPWGTMEVNPGMDPAETDWRNWVDDWDYVRETVAMFEAGELADPLPGAMHWGSTADGNEHGGIPMPRVIVSIVETDEPVALRNHFYALEASRLRCYRAVMLGDVQAYSGSRCST